MEKKKASNLPSENITDVWIRTKGQITQAEQKQRKVSSNEIETFLEKKGFSNFKIIKKRIRIIPLNSPGNPLELGEEIIDEIANELDFKTGKWNIYPDEDEVDGNWEKVKNLVEEGKIWSAKVSTKRQINEKNSDNYAICVYTKDYTDKERVMEVREILRKDGFDEPLYYKPDIYTILGIYSHNARDFGLKGASKYRS